MKQLLPRLNREFRQGFTMQFKPKVGLALPLEEIEQVICPAVVRTDKDAPADQRSQLITTLNLVRTVHPFDWKRQLKALAPELEEAARTAGANDLIVKRDVTVPLIKYGMLASWLLIFLIFVREYSTGIYLLGPGTEVIGSLLVSLWGTGAIDLVSALSVVNVVMIGVGLAVAVRLGVRLHG